MVYRDGVSEGEFGLVLLHELSAIKQAAEELGGSPRTTFCVVQKRHAVRRTPTRAHAHVTLGLSRVGKPCAVGGLSELRARRNIDDRVATP